MNELNQAYNIGWEFLQRMDRYLCQHLNTLKCEDINKIYNQFWKDLKEFKGNAEGFTGLSEFLLFRAVYHLLEQHTGSPFCRRPVSPDLYEFVNNDFKIGQSLPITIGNTTRRPDIVIYRNPNNPILIGVSEIKVYLTYGKQTIDEAFNNFQNLQNFHPPLQALFIIFGGVSQDMEEYLQQLQTENNWFRFLILYNNQNLLAEELRNWLGL